MKHIWLYSMKKSEDELRSNTSQSRYGSHEYLLNEVVKYIGNLQNKLSANDIRNLRIIFCNSKDLELMLIILTQILTFKKSKFNRTF